MGDPLADATVESLIGVKSSHRLIQAGMDRDEKAFGGARIRLVHAQVRRLLRRYYGEWDAAVFGTPLSAAHMGLSSANFSASMLREAQRLGAKLDQEARVAFMQIWRYASWLVGTPDELLFKGDEDATIRFRDVAVACEPAPNHESAMIANRLVQALPLASAAPVAVELREAAAGRAATLDEGVPAGAGAVGLFGLPGRGLPGSALALDDPPTD